MLVERLESAIRHWSLTCDHVCQCHNLNSQYIEAVKFIDGLCACWSACTTSKPFGPLPP
jgi:hypothetical protein